MGKFDRAGFTIIETMLFLAVTGVLIVGILVSTGGAISGQRYRDSVSSLQSFIQGQYADVANVSNDKNITTDCGPNIARGQSDCVILGRYITATASAGRSIQLVSRVVIGKIPAILATNVSDIKILMKDPLGNNSNRGYNAQIVDIVGETVKYDIEWDSSMVIAGSNSPLSFSLFIVKSPSNGYIKTLINSTSVISDVQFQGSLVNIPTSLTSSLKMCVNDYDFKVVNKRAVVVNANASSAAGVELLSETNSGC